MTRKIACARKENSETFDVVADGAHTASGCPLANELTKLSGESFDVFLSALIRLGIVERSGDNGIYKFAEMHAGCPFTQPVQPTTQPLEKQP